MPSEFPGRRDVWEERTERGRGCGKECGKRGREGLATFYANSCVRISHFSSFAFSVRFNFGIREKFQWLCAEGATRWILSQLCLARTHACHPARTWLCLSGRCLFSYSSRLILLQFLGKSSVYQRSLPPFLSLSLSVPFPVTLPLFRLSLAFAEMAFKIGK